MKNIAPAWTFVIAPAIVFGVLQAQQTIPATPPAPPTLMLADAEHMAIEHNPRISVARLLQLAQAQVTREVRSGELPAAAASLTAVDSHNGSRITAGALNNPIVYERAAGGLTVSQLITDFGRTHNLILSAQSQAKAQLDTERATTEDIVLAVDQAFYSALTSQAVLKVAEETVAARQATADQISALSAAKLRSTLDLSFANVELSQARLLLLDAQNAAQSSMANLNALLGSEQDEQYALVDQAPENPEPGSARRGANGPDGLQLSARPRRPQRQLQRSQTIQLRRTCPGQANCLRTRGSGRDTGPSGSDSFLVVWSRGRQREYPDLQRFSLFSTRARGRPSRKRRWRRGQKSARADRPRRSNRGTVGAGGLSTNRSDQATT